MKIVKAAALFASLSLVSVNAHATGLVEWLGGFSAAEQAESVQNYLIPKSNPQQEKAEFERRLNEAVTSTQDALTKSDAHGLGSFQSMMDVLAIEWTPAYLTDRSHAPNLKAYTAINKFAGAYIDAKADLVDAFNKVMRDGAVLKRLLKNAQYGDFDFSENVDRSYTENALRSIDSGLHGTSFDYNLGNLQLKVRTMTKRIAEAEVLITNFEGALGVSIRKQP